MDYNHILLTGATGRLGKKLAISTLKERELLTPTREELDITDKASIDNYFSTHTIDAIIHCAALVNGREAENNPSLAIETNIIGTTNLVQQAIRKNARFIYISTDYVYPCVKGPYSEKDAVMPFTVYGWTKLGGECAVKNVKNYCVIRTSLYDPENINFNDAPSNAFTSKMSFSELSDAIIFLLDNKFTGTINVGEERKSLYELYRKHKPEIKPIKLEDIPKEAQRAPDSSLDISLWRKIKNGN